MTSFAALLREPMLHFLLGGALIFGLFGLAGGDRDVSREVPSRAAPPNLRIVVSRGQVESLTQGFASRWRRAPTDEELAALIAEHVREEMLVREALALGLDRDDVVIRRHLRTRMEFVVQDVDSLRAPTDDDLRALLEREADRFRQPAMLTFRHVYLDPSRRGEAAAHAEAAQLLRLLQGADAATVAEEAGDRFLPGYEFRDLSAPQVARLFGESFAAALETAPLDRWAGPIASAYGLHLVQVEARLDAQLPPLEVVAPLLRAELAGQQRREAIDSFLRALLSRYTVTVEDPAQEAAPKP